MIKASSWIIFLLTAIFAMWLFRPRMISVSYININLSTTQANMHELRISLDLYKIRNGTYPSENSWSTLIEKEFNSDSSLFIDGWGNKFLYKKRNENFSIISLGADGEEGGIGLNEDIIYSQE